MSTEDQMSIEDRVRTATRAGASLIRDVRPLGAPAPVRLRHRPRPAPRRWVAWAVPLAAAAAVMAIALTLVAVRQPGATSPAGGQSATATAPAAVPRYYATLQNNLTAGTFGPLIVGDDHTGKVIDTVSPPSGLVFKSVQGTSDDRTFVVMTAGLTGAPTYTLDLLRIAPGSTTHPYQLTKLPVRLPGNSPYALAYALSPDGRELAVESEPSSASAVHVVTLGIYSVSDGARVRAWTTSAKITPTLGASTLSWLSGGRQLVFSAGDFTTGSSNALQLRSLDVKGAGTDLIAASRMLLGIDDSGVSACVSLRITPDGATAICSTQYPVVYGSGSNAGCANGGVEFIAFPVPVRGSKPVRTLYQYRGACHEGVAYVPWTDASGNSVIGVIDIDPGNEGGKQAVHVGVITDGHLRPLKIASFSSPWAYASLVF